MFINKKIFILTIVCSGVCCYFLQAQATLTKDMPATKKQSLVLYIGGGFSQYVAPVNIQTEGIQSHISRVSPAGTLRLLWQPQFRLRLGLETGFCNFYAYQLKKGNKIGKVNVSAIPLMVVWSMPIVKRLDIFAGFGSYLLTSKLDYEGKVSSHTYSLGTSIAIAYKVPISKISAIAAEIKWMSAFQTRDDVVSAEVRYVWKFLQWK